MKYILDFDDTLFDAKKLKQILEQCGIAEDSISESTFDQIAEKMPGFNVSALLFPDALQFLQDHAHECEVVSTYLSSDVTKNTPENEASRKSFQMKKIVLCGVTELLGEDRVHIVGTSKLDALSEIKMKCEAQEPKESCVFVDDKKEYMVEAESLGILSYRMNRDGQGWGLEHLFASAEKNEIRTFAGFESVVLSAVDIEAPL